MGSDAVAFAAVVAFLVAVLAVVFLPLLLARRDWKRGSERRSGSGDLNISSSMNDIVNLS